MEMQRALVTEDAGRIRSWQHDSYHRKLFGGFKEVCELENGFQRAQKPWTKKLKKVGRTFGNSLGVEIGKDMKEENPRI